MNNLNEINNGSKLKRSERSFSMIQKSSDLKKTIENKISTNNKHNKANENKSKIVDFKRKKI